jgi:Ni2+-binding GTPase involved in maturation of urease and hydrogenase
VTSFPTDRPVDLEIIVRGQPGAGKTHVSHALLRLLKGLGFDVVLEDDPREPPRSTDEVLNAEILKSIASNRVVTIRTVIPGPHHEPGCGTAARGCVPGCDNFDPEWDR